VLDAPSRVLDVVACKILSLFFLAAMGAPAARAGTCGPKTPKDVRARWRVARCRADPSQARLDKKV